MEDEELMVNAKYFFELLKSTPYPGRGVMAGWDKTGRFYVLISWITGRGKDSRNRVYEKDDSTGKVWIEAADPNKLTDKTNRFYTPMLEVPPLGFVASNGEQTDVIVEQGLSQAQCAFAYERDSLNTPRISALIFIPKIVMAIIRKSRYGCERADYTFEKILPGMGYCLTTYTGNDNPPTAFDKEPYPLPLEGDIDTILETYWKALNEENRVSLAVKFIPIYGDNGGKSMVKIINKYPRVEAKA